MLRLEVLDDICQELGWVPVIDCDTDTLGTNAIAVAYFDVFVNFLKQKMAIAGKDLVINPPY